MRLNVRVRDGAGPTLLLAHSVGCDATLWDPLAATLPAHYRLIAYDTRGHGRSSAPSGDYHIEQLGLDALAVLDAVGVRRAHLCGLSLGGTTAQWLALHRPERLTSITLADTAARLGTPEGWSSRIDAALRTGMASLVDMSMTRFFSATFRETEPTVVGRFREIFLATPAHGFAGCCAALRDADARPRLGAIAVPTLVIVGRFDEPTPVSDSEELARGITGAALVILDAGHVSAVEDPNGFATALIRHVEHAESVQR